MNSEAAESRARQRVEELCAAAIRAVSGDPDVHLRAGRMYRGHTACPVGAPHLRPSVDDDFGSFRGVADGLALRLRHSGQDLHRKLSPKDDVARLVFEMLEQFRVEALAPTDTPGVAGNLRHRHESWSRAFHESGLTETAQGILLYTVAQVCRSRVTGQPVVEDTEDLIEATRFTLAPILGKDLAALRRHRRGQAAYAVHALAIAEAVASLIQGCEVTADDDGTTRHRRGALSLLVDSSGDDDTGSTVTSGSGGLVAATEHGYDVFTRQYDRIVDVSTLVRPALLQEYRRRLDARIADQGVNLARLTRALTTLLAEPAEDGWDGGQETGIIDGRCLTRLVTSPTERRLFRTPRIEPIADCLVTFLVDCSGSMKQHNESVAMIVDVFSRALDVAGVSNEVLGFTTGAWSGGRALHDWKQSGSPRQPGRLNEVHHLVIKNADVPWRLARHGIAGLLKDDLYREGVDGEAVTWASSRMQRRVEQHRLLIVVSDGSPMDGATSLANDPHYLDHHLRQVVLREELHGSSLIYGLGVGLDLSAHYPRSHALDLEKGVRNEAFGEILGMLSGRGRR